jgi:hypothetical protein
VLELTLVCVHHSHRSDVVRKKAREEVGGVIHSIRADFQLQIARSTLTPLTNASLPAPAAAMSSSTSAGASGGSGSASRPPSAAAGAMFNVSVTAPDGSEEKGGSASGSSTRATPSPVPTANSPTPPLNSSSAGVAGQPLSTPLPRVEHTLACLHSDCLLHYYRLQLLLGRSRAVSKATQTLSAREASARALMDSGVLGMSQSASSLRGTAAAATRTSSNASSGALPGTSGVQERVLSERCGANRYERAILYLQMSALRTTVPARQKLLMLAQQVIQLIFHLRPTFLQRARFCDVDIGGSRRRGEHSACVVSDSSGASTS